MKGGQQTVTQQVDPATQRYVDQLRQAALGYAGIGGGRPTAAARPGFTPGPGFGWGGTAGFDFRNRVRQMQPTGATAPTDGSALNLPQATIDPALRDVLSRYQGYADIGQTGLTALAGGANPFMNQYLSALDPVYNQIRAQSLGSIGDAAQLAGAFGGSRQGVAEGTALGQIGQQQAYANIDAYNQSLNRAGQAAGLGLAGLGGTAELARYMQEYPQLFASRQLGLLQQGIGPYGQTQTTQMSSDPFSQLLGLGLFASNFFAPGASSAALPMVI